MFLVQCSRAGQFSVGHVPQNTTQPNGPIIPKHVNLVYSKGFVRDAALDAMSWLGLSMQFLPHAPSASGDGMYVMSFVAVDLGPEYAGVSLPGQITGLIAGADPALHHFSFDYLQPYVTTFLGYLMIGEDVPEPAIQNSRGPDG